MPKKKKKSVLQKQRDDRERKRQQSNVSLVYYIKKIHKKSALKKLSLDNILLSRRNIIILSLQFSVP